MANHPSALKRQRQNDKRRMRNRSCKSTINTTIKKIFTSFEDKDTDKATQFYKDSIAIIDSAVNKGVLHKKTASRRISRLTKRFNTLSA